MISGIFFPPNNKITARPMITHCHGPTAKKILPELMKGLGSGIKEFKDASKDDSSNEETKE